MVAERLASAARAPPSTFQIVIDGDELPTLTVAGVSAVNIEFVLYVAENNNFLA